MAAAATGQVYQVTFVGTMCLQRIMNTFHYVVENVPVGGATVEQVYDALETHFEAPGSKIDLFCDCVPTSYTMDAMWIQCIGPTQRYVKRSVTEGVSGLFPFSADLANVSGVITRTTEKSGRSQVSSLHLPIGATPDWLNDGVLRGDVITAYQLLCDDIPVQIGGAPLLSLDPVIYHGPVPFAVPDDIIRAVPQTTARVMRRRTVGLGI